MAVVDDRIENDTREERDRDTGGRHTGTHDGGGHTDDSDTGPRFGAWPAEALVAPALRLDPISPADVADMVAALPDGECGAWGPVPGPLDEVAAERFVARYEHGRLTGSSLAWTVRTMPDGHFAGAVVLLRSGLFEAELGYWVAPSARGRGVATSALALATDAALGRLGLERAWVEISAENRASRRVAEKVGYFPTVSCDSGACSIAAAPPAAQEAVGDTAVYERLRLTPFPAGLTARAPTMDDVDPVTELREICEMHDAGESCADRAETESDWRTLPGFDLARDALVVLKDDTIVAFGWLLDEHEHRQLVADFDVHPRHRDPRLVAAVLDRLEDRARDHAARTPDGMAVLDGYYVAARADGPATPCYKRELFEAHGYHKVREFLRMGIELDAVVDVPAWPTGISVTPIVPGRDDAAAHATLNEAFAEHFRAAPMTLPDWQAYVYENPHFEAALFLVAREGEQVVGVCQSFFYPDRRLGYVDELGVRPPWRRRGLASALLRAAFRDLRERGARRVLLGVDADNSTGALGVYERAGMARRLRTDVYSKALPAPLPAVSASDDVT